MGEFQQLWLPLSVLVIGLFASILIKTFSLGFFGFVSSLVLGTAFLGLSFQQITELFPSALFLQLMGLFLFFAIVEESGVLKGLVAGDHRFLVNNKVLIPLLVFLVCAGVSASGLGNISSLALLAPIGFKLAEKFKMPFFPMALLMVGGANAASLSPLTTAGIVLHNGLHKMKLVQDTSYEQIGFGAFIYVLFFVAIVTFLGFFIFGGWHWLKSAAPSNDALQNMSLADPTGATKQQNSMVRGIKVIILLLGINILLQATVTKVPNALSEVILGLKTILSLPVLGWCLAFYASLSHWVTSEKLFKNVSWDVLFMIIGMAFFMEVLSKAGFAQWVAIQLMGSMTEAHMPAALAGASALLSAFTSSTGVVLPLFLPLVQELQLQYSGNTELNALLFPMLLGAHLVDASPLSTLGALCIAAVGAESTRKLLYNKLLIWGFMMIPVAGAIGYLSTKLF